MARRSRARSRASRALSRLVSALCALALFAAAGVSADPGADLGRALLTMRNTKAKPDFSEGTYADSATALEEVRRVVRENERFMRLETMRETRGGYSSELLVVTVEPSLGVDPDPGSASSAPPASGIDKTRVLYNYGEHGRELITVEVALELLRAFALGPDHVASLASPTAGTREQTRAAYLSSVFKIVPMENVNGRAKVEAGDWCERKNGRGVDCNRNWAVDWGVKAPDYDPYEEYPGTAPFSEPEAFMLKSLLDDFRPHVWVNVHSGMEALFLPFDHVAQEPTGPGADAMRTILRAINSAHCGDRCVVAGGGLGVGYLAHGTATDYVYVAAKVPVTFTWEIYGDQEAHYLDCFRMFNPIDKTHKEEVVAAWVGAGVSLLPMLRAHPDVPMRAALDAEGLGGGEALLGGAAEIGASAARLRGGGGGGVGGGGAGARAKPLPSELTHLRWDAAGTGSGGGRRAGPAARGPGGRVVEGRSDRLDVGLGAGRRRGYRVRGGARDGGPRRGGVLRRGAEVEADARQAGGGAGEETREGLVRGERGSGPEEEEEEEGAFFCSSARETRARVR